MARHFTAVSNQYLNASAALVTAPPMTIAGWIKNDTSSTSVLAAIAGTGTATPWAGIFPSVTTNTVRFAWASSSTPQSATTVATLAPNVWGHIAGTTATLSTRTVYLNGGNAVTDANTAGGLAGITSTYIGVTWQNGILAPANGSIADVGIWNVVLTAAEIAALANGVRPYQIRPLNLVAYYPCDGLASPEPDLSGNKNNAVLTNGPTLASGPPIMPFTPRWPQNNVQKFAPSYAINRNVLTEGLVT